MTVQATALHAGKANAPSGPAQGTMDRNTLAAQIPFVISQVPFPGTNTQVKMGQGLLVQVAAVSANTDFTIQHNMGHPVNVIIPCFGASNVFIPKVKISSTAKSNTTKQLIVQFDTICNPVRLAIF
jgi:hypothetical protein